MDSDSQPGHRGPFVSQWEPMSQLHPHRSARGSQSPDRGSLLS